MSRSYKKHPFCTDQVTWKKKQYNKRIRRTPDLMDGCDYKRRNESWDIRDFIIGPWGDVPMYRFRMK